MGFWDAGCLHGGPDKMMLRWGAKCLGGYIGDRMFTCLSE